MDTTIYSRISIPEGVLNSTELLPSANGLDDIVA